MEENYNHPVDRLFQEKLSFNETKPAGKVWNKIAGELDKADNKANERRSKKRFFLTLSLTGILLLLNFIVKDYSGMSLKTERSLPMVSVAGPGFISNQLGKQPIETRTDILYAYQDPKLKINLPAVLKTERQISTLNAPLTALPFPQTGNQIPGQGINPGNTESRSLIRVQPGTSHRLSVEPFFLKEFAGYNFSDHDVTGNNGKKIEQRERNVFSASSGFYLNYALGSRWIFQTGLVYSWSESNIDSSSTYAKISENGTIQFKFNTVSGYTYLHPPSSMAPAIGDSIHTAGTVSDLRYISIPLIISCRIPLKKFSALLGVGSTFNILSSAVLETDIYDANFVKHESQIPLKGLKKTNVGLIVKAELSYQLTNHWSVNGMSSFKNTLGPINLNSAVSAYPYNIGVGLGVNYHF